MRRSLSIDVYNRGTGKRHHPNPPHDDNDGDYWWLGNLSGEAFFVRILSNRNVCCEAYPDEELEVHRDYVRFMCRRCAGRDCTHCLHNSGYASLRCRMVLLHHTDIFVTVKKMPIFLLLGEIVDI